MRWLKNSLIAVVLTMGIVLVGSGTASAAGSHRPAVSQQETADGVTIAGEWRWGGLFGNQITCNAEGVFVVTFTTADDYQCLPPGPGGTHWTLMLYYE